MGVAGGNLSSGGWQAENWVRDRAVGGYAAERGGRDEMRFDDYDEWGRGSNGDTSLGFRGPAQRYEAVASAHSNKRSHAHAGLTHGCVPGMDMGRSVLHESAVAARHPELCGGSHSMAVLHGMGGLDHGGAFGEAPNRLRGSEMLHQRILEHDAGLHLDPRDAHTEMRYRECMGDGRYMRAADAAPDGRFVHAQGDVAVLGYSGANSAQRAACGSGVHRGLGETGSGMMRAQRSEGAGGRFGVDDDGGDAGMSSGTGSGRLVETWLGSYLTSRALQVTPPSRRVAPPLPVGFSSFLSPLSPFLLLCPALLYICRFACLSCR